VKFSTRTLYGLKAVLVLAARFGEGSLSVSQIAKKEGISVAYLEQILNNLKRKGLVKSVRGPQGGYVLAKKPSEITLDKLFYTLLDKNNLEANLTIPPKSEIDEIGLANLIFWKKFKASLEENLKKTSVKSLIDEARHLKKTKPDPLHTFNI
jgi:Rrf2 family transcriptional regulator, cysteine metabolism repressor